MRDSTNALGGYVRLYRRLLDWEWFQDSATLHVYLFLLLSACFRPVRHQGIDLLPGQLITARRRIAQRTGLSEQQVRTALEHLASTREITIAPSRRFSVITLVHFSRYQQALAPPPPASSPNLSPVSSPASSPTEPPTANPPAAHDPPKKNKENHVNQEKKEKKEHQRGAAYDDQNKRRTDDQPPFSPYRGSVKGDGRAAQRRGDPCRGLGVCL